MKYTDEDCKKALLTENVSLSSIFLVDSERTPGNYLICSIYHNTVFSHLISNNDLAFACVNFLIKNGNRVYENFKQFENENPNIN